MKTRCLLPLTPLYDVHYFCERVFGQSSIKPHIKLLQVQTTMFQIVHGCWQSENAKHNFVTDSIEKTISVSKNSGI